MNNLLNSSFTQWILKFALSKGGVAVRWIVALIIGAVAKKEIFPEGDLKEIEMGLTSGLMALLAMGYGFFEWWVQHRQKDGVRVIQEMTRMADGPQMPKVDGIAGNETIKAVAKATGVSAGVAVDSVKS